MATNASKDNPLFAAGAKGSVLSRIKKRAGIPVCQKGSFEGADSEQSGKESVLGLLKGSEAPGERGLLAVAFHGACGKHQPGYSGAR